MADSSFGRPKRGGGGNARGSREQGYGGGRAGGGGGRGGARGGSGTEGEFRGRGRARCRGGRGREDVRFGQTSGSASLAAGPGTPVSSSSGATLEMSLGGDKYLPRRPGGGTQGEKIEVSVNCWDLDVADTVVYRYDIQPDQLIARSKDGEKVLRTGEKGLQKMVKYVADIMGDDVFSDGRRFFYSLTRLNSRFNVDGDNLMTLPENEGQDLVLKYKIKEVGTMSAHPIKEYLSNPSARTDDLPQDSINMLDNLLRWINRSRFSIFKSCLLGAECVPSRSESFHIFKGYSISARPQWKLRINVDLTYKAFLPAANLADVLYAKYRDALYEPRGRGDIEKSIKGLQVEARHYKNAESGKAYSKRLVVHGFSTQAADRQWIPEKNMTIAQYFQSQYGIRLQYGDLPCVKTKKDRDEYMPLELLYVLPFQNPIDDAGTVASEIVRIAAVKPPQRYGQIQSFVRQAITQCKLVRQMGLRIPSQHSVRVDARVLPQPNANFRGTTMKLSRGSWQAAPFVQPASNSVKYAIINMLPSRENDYNKLKSGLESIGRRLGLALHTGHPVLSKQPCQLSETFVQLRNEGVRLVVCILNRNDCYGEIKRVCELETFMVTQCVKSETLKKPNPWGNILLKINGKLGGLNWSISDLANQWEGEVVMVVGADVTHHAFRGSQGLRKSVAAVVASVSANYMRYVAIVRQQDYLYDPKLKEVREYIDEMEAIFRELLETFYRLNNVFPSKIIFYRDGVSEGQFKRVVMKELSAMQRACTAIRPGYEPGFTFIVVQKRHHIRFFQENQLANVPPGTVVDSEITHRREFDFYLCSHQGIQGTSKPAHYHVIYDDNNLGSDELQLFTYFLCHAYMRCTRSVSYPAPTYYSHLAAFRARDWLKGAPNPEHLMRNNQFMLLPEQRELMFFL